MKKSDSFNVAVNAPLSVAKKAIAISRALRRRGTLFMLDGKTHYPHVTMYMAEYPLKNIPEVIARLAKIFSSVRSFPMKSLEYHQGAIGYVDVSFGRSPEISRLQKLIVRTLNPLREGLLRSADQKKLRMLPAAQRKSIRRYGYRSVGKEYRPHLTLTRLVKRKWNARVLADIPKRDFSFIAREVVLLWAGKHGTGREVVKRFRLRGR